MRIQKIHLSAYAPLQLPLKKFCTWISGLLRCKRKMRWGDGNCQLWSSKWELALKTHRIQSLDFKALSFTRHHNPEQTQSRCTVSHDSYKDQFSCYFCIFSLSTYSQVENKQLHHQMVCFCSITRGALSCVVFALVRFAMKFNLPDLDQKRVRETYFSPYLGTCK